MRHLGYSAFYLALLAVTVGCDGPRDGSPARKAPATQPAVVGPTAMPATKPAAIGPTSTPATQPVVVGPTSMPASQPAAAGPASMPATQPVIIRLAPLPDSQTINIVRKSSSALSKDDQVRLIVFRELLDSYEAIYPKPDPNRLNAFYLAVGVPPDKQKPDDERTDWKDHGDPSKALLAAIGTRKIPIKTISQCKTSTGRCLDRTTGKPGYILRVGPIKWLDADTATLEAGHWEHLMGASGKEWKLKRRGDKWEVSKSRGGWVS